MNNEEMLSVYDDELNEIGRELRSEIHSKGLLHQVVHCWIVDNSVQEKWIYFQQRSYKKRDFPGLYDISAAGHMDVGEEAEEAVKRETQEEVGIVIDPKKLKFVGTIREKLKLNEFFNNEICQIYLYPVKRPKFYPGYEVEKMVKISLGELKKYVFDDLENIEAFLVDTESKIIIRSQDFCLHKKEYLEVVIDFIEGL
jgi:isopentenyldiphosphate isomerase